MVMLAGTAAAVSVRAQALSVRVDRAQADLVVSWNVLQTALEYVVLSGPQVSSTTSTVRLISNRYSEPLPREKARFYRVGATVDVARVVTNRIHLDQFGYLPLTEKITVISNPQEGFNADESFTPGNQLHIRSAPDGATVFTGAPAPWNGGATHTNSGDQVWWFDFSSVTNPGNYYVYDASNGVSSYAFRVADNVYDDAMKQALRTFYYQRCNHSKVEPYAERDWTDPIPCHMGPDQDLDCRLVTNPVSATSLDLAGGWHDAGDYNKYVNFADKPIHDLLSAYEQRPDVWHDHNEIPESGNGIPDLLDTIKYELDWLLEMQRPDGSVLHKVAAVVWGFGSPPSTDAGIRRYAPPTASATISTCGAFAHAALVYRDVPDADMQAYSGTLTNAALRAWQWLEDHPDRIPSSYDNAGFLTDDAEDLPYYQKANRISASVYLFAMTGDTAFRDFFDSNYTNVNMLQWHYIYASEAQFQDALLYYTAVSNATPAVANDIETAYVNAARKMLQHHTDEEDAYRAWIDVYYWGSNHAKSDNGSMMHNILTYGWDSGQHSAYRRAASAYVHYLHGVNPMDTVYLSNMERYGAERSVPEFYHQWFADGTDWDNATTSLYGPAPGYIPGGANPNYAPDAAYTNGPIVPPQNQPAQKSYRSWNADWPENSWEITENAIYSQAAYVKLLSKFASPDPP